MELSRLLIVKQTFPHRRLDDIPGTVQSELSAAGFSSRLCAGSRIAIGVGSRGIANIALIVHSIVAFWKAQGMAPFIFPAMGSHGAATAEGQAAVLAKYGITEASMGCPICSSLEVVDLGKTPHGVPVFMDRSAYQADAVFLVGRVKWHTDFAGKLESGLFKMMAIGLGKFAGAQHYHTYAYKLGLEEVIRSVGRCVLASGKILGGLAILEDAYHQTAQLSVVPVHEMERREEELLKLVKSWMGRIPVDLDVLILDEIGKDISGSGMDTKVVNRGVQGEYNPWPATPRIERIYIRNITPLSYGNGVGLGLADVVSDRLLEKLDWKPIRINALTASAPAAGRIPIHYPSDWECLEAIVPTVGKINSANVTIGWLKNTLELGLMALSENLLPQIRDNAMLTIEVDPREIVFDHSGNLPPTLMSFNELTTKDHARA
jgi:hypothetical protein